MLDFTFEIVRQYTPRCHEYMHLSHTYVYAKEEHLLYDVAVIHWVVSYKIDMNTRYKTLGF